MTTSAEIEAAADRLPVELKEELFLVHPVSPYFLSLKAVSLVLPE
jgi:hypothetical protein